MCGLAAIYAYHYVAPAVSREELLKINEAMRSRGPDGAGQWHSEDGRVGLAHRRLSIIDLSEAAAQPMVSEDQKIIVTFNGEIYNYRSLRQELEREGVVFRSQSDTEVLIHLYARDGVGMLNKLRGMFAFSIWDERKRAMLLARDPYGIKPLYYADDGWTCRVASQVKALLAGGKVSRERDPAGIAGFYLFGSVPEPYTWVFDVRAVPAGHYLWVTELGTRLPQSYFSVSKAWTEASERVLPHLNRDVEHVAENSEIVHAALRDSVRHHLVADVPVGIFLSAGMDSGALLGLMRDAGQRDIRAITLGFREFEGHAHDEVPLARSVADHYGTEHITRYVTESEFLIDLPEILAAMDQPTLDGLNTWFVSKAAHEAGFKVALTGLGGDELFGGYPSFRDLPRWVSLLKLPAAIPGLGVALRKVFPSHLSQRMSNPKLPGLLEYGGSYAGAYLLKRGLFMPWELPALMGHDEAAHALERLQPLSVVQSTAGGASAYGNVASLESSLYMRNQLLRDADWAGMAHSLEIRTPLVDASLLTAIAGILTQQKPLSGKALLTSSPSRSLPSAITTRAKTGFTTPIAEWLKKIPNSGSQQPAILKSGQHWSRKWAASVLDSGEF